MATLSDPRALGFNADLFREAVGFAMDMGAPDSESERLTFRWNTVKTFTNADPAGKPFDFGSTPTSVQSKDDVVARGAVDFASRSNSATGNSVGEFNNPRVVITMLDDDYALIVDEDLGLPDEIIFDGDIYNFDYVAPPQGLFAVTIYTIYATAKDEH